MEKKLNYSKPLCEVLEFVEQSVLCGSTLEGMSFSNPWRDLGSEEEW